MFINWSYSKQWGFDLVATILYGQTQFYLEIFKITKTVNEKNDGGR